jgi:hypothetical protein
MPGSSTGMWYSGVAPPPSVMGVGVDISLRAGV